MTQFDFNVDAIAHVLADRILAVPIFQRSYAWNEDQVGEFWDDIINAYRQNGQEYFVGNLVFSREEREGDAVSIIDGQQRLATTLLLLTSLRDEHSSRGEQDAADELHTTFVSTYDPRSREQRPRLTLNSEDNVLFRRLTVEKVSPETENPSRSSHRLICSAYLSLRRSVENFASAAGDNWYSELLELREFLEKRLRVVIVDVPTDADAFLIFETLNDRGADLTISDLLKNYLFRRAEIDLDVVRNAWMRALGALDVTAENRAFVTFLRHFWSSSYGATRERDLFKGIKSRVATRAHAVDFGTDLEMAAGHHAAILNSDHDYWAEFGDRGKANVDTLNRLSLEQLRPLLLALMKHFTERELRQSLRALVSWGVRGLVVGGIGGGTAEKAYCDAAVKVRGGAIKTIQQLLTELEQFVPSDKEFETAFATRRVSNGKLARYYLHALERVADENPQPELIPNHDAEEVNLEHILPKNPVEHEWPQFDQDEQSVWAYRLGNMALLQKGSNDRIGNKAWSIKKPALARSRLRLTQRAASQESWGKVEIDDAQQYMATLALEAWPRLP